ncbi:acetylglutamate kinase [Candidatus Liberibacter africanus]|uniref:acetylglutamate kinase n=1 Tax=Liberibacter africanus TaxID=34020 RepID=UPI001AE4A26A|nr:acetylglutamate kinase [Candidatus Liberibacter africanus]QTP63962.1 acetylglutamate kinase [Candidatus Liberibacter africanus]
MTEKIYQFQANILEQAIPFVHFYENKTIVIKYGGHVMDCADLSNNFATDIALLQKSNITPIIVHGGGPQIGAVLEKMGIKSKFKNGLRITDQKTAEVVEMVLAGSINKNIVSLINQSGAQAIGICGKDSNMVFAEKYLPLLDSSSNTNKKIDLGFVGKITEVNRTILDILTKSKIIPVIAPIAPGYDGATYNVNADTFAGAIAGKLNAIRLLFLTNVPGVLDKNKKLISKLSIEEARFLIKDGTISGGMIPKIETSIKAIENGVKSIAILDGTKKHSILMEILTKNGSGTLLVP